ncbi:kinase-like domain-containing protein [Xylaria digitata]|nr:kinase-like domain-containing protein [Xylaria digitata]
MDNLKSVSCAIALAFPPALRNPINPRPPGESIDIQGIPQVQEARLLATGGYNSVLLVKLHEPLEVSHPATTLSYTTSTLIHQFALRLPGEDSLLPNQITNDVAFKRFVAAKLPHIPVPKVYLYSATHQADTSFIVEEYIDCPTLSSTWMSLSNPQKENIAQKLATMTVDLAEVRFDLIGGLNPIDFSSAPTVEGSKLFKGRGKFHRNECYPIGPYKSTKEYILNCYDREIYYYSHASDEDIDADFFSEVTVPDFVKTLTEERAALTEVNITDEPFVLVHGDFHGRNILAKGDQIMAVIDWDFAGSYPLSETLTSGDVDVVEAVSEELDEENDEWGLKIRQFIQREVIKRGWDPVHIDLLMGDGDQEVARARVEMIPWE